MLKKIFLLLLLGSGCQIMDNGQYRGQGTEIKDDDDGALAPTDQSIADACRTILAQKTFQPLKSLNELKERFLKSHNAVRSLYGVKALAWDEKLESYAQEWANYLRDNYHCKMHHRFDLGLTKGKSFGENLAWNAVDISMPTSFMSSPEEVTHWWARECRDYNYEKNSCKAGKKCGHFTQMVWKKTRLVGCGMAVCDDKDEHSEVWVCSYDPPGNVTLYRGGDKGVPLKPF